MQGLKRTGTPVWRRDRQDGIMRNVSRKGRWLVRTVTVPKNLTSCLERMSAQILPCLFSFYLDMNDLILKL